MARDLVAALVVVSAALCACAGGADLERRRFVGETSAPRADDAELASRFSRETFVAADGARLPYRLLTPPVSAPGVRRAVVIVLHGSGAVGDDDERQLGPFARSWAAPGLAASFPAFVLVPQTAARTADYERDADGLPASRAGAPLGAVIALADEFASRPDVDAARVYVVGFSMGGSAALAAVATRPDLFAAAASFSGVAPPRALAARAASVPQLLVHGTADEENPIGPDRAWASAVAAAGGRPRLVEYEGMDHRVPPDMIAGREWREWLFRQRRDAGGTRR